MSEVLFLFIVVTVLLVLNGMFVAAEFAIISIPRIKLEHEAAQGNQGAQRLLTVVSNSLSQDRYIALAQMGITLASLGLGMYGEHALAGLIAPYLEQYGTLGTVAAHSLATLLSLLFLTFWHIVAGEMIPKSLALLYPMPTALTLWWPMKICGFVLAPLSWVLNGIGNLMLRLLGLPVSQDLALVYSPEELRMVMEESRDEGLLPPEQHQMLERVIDFGERPLRLVMIPRTQIVGLSDEALVSDAIEVLKAEEYSRYPVYHGDRDNITGYVHVKDLFAALRRGELDRKVSEICHELAFLPESLPLDEAMDRLRAANAHMAVVVEDRGGTAGIVTAEDLIEELFGEIRDEFDLEEVALVEKLKDGFRVSGQLRLFELEEILDRPINTGSDDAETVSALLSDLLHKVPDAGDELEHDGFRFRVESMTQHTVEFCLITPLEAMTENSEEAAAE